ncbi:MAG: hypothetical protein ACP5NC_04390 [Nitrososphaeria archaeon]
MHVSIDLGIKTQITLSNILKVEYQIHPSEKLKELQKMIRKKIWSRRYRIAKLTENIVECAQTQKCYNCHKHNKVSLKERIYICGLTIDRIDNDSKGPRYNLNARG